MSRSFPRHVRPNPIPQWLSPRTEHIRSPSWVREMLARHVWPQTQSGSLTPEWADSLGGLYKSPPPCLSSPVGHSVQHGNTLRQSLELPTSLLQASFKSKLTRRDLSLTLEWPTWSSTQARRRWSPCVHYSWVFIPLDRLGCPRVTKVVVDFRKFVLPSPLWGFDSGNRTRSWWSFRVD
jgi:hypothetical protein